MLHSFPRTHFLSTLPKETSKSTNQLKMIVMEMHSRDDEPEFVPTQHRFFFKFSQQVTTLRNSILGFSPVPPRRVPHVEAIHAAHEELRSQATLDAKGCDAMLPYLLIAPKRKSSPHLGEKLLAVLLVQDILKHSHLCSSW